ncbi:MAG TPA: acyl carrier protein [Bryobacteraceae bacterium]|jgi:acyl carrier protein|nr:acyl carrier protein [Bryobacteraceae bacterium]
MQDELTKRVIAVMAATQHIPEDKIDVEKSFQELGIDSLDGINILFALENEFDINIPDDAAKEIKTVRDMIEGVRKLVEWKAEAGSTASA